MGVDAHRGGKSAFRRSYERSDGVSHNRMRKPACSKWLSVVSASRIPQSYITTNDRQSVKLHALSLRRS